MALEGPVIPPTFELDIIEAKPLPKNPYNANDASQGVWHAAYEECLRLERAADLAKDLIKIRWSPLVLARLLGYMILEAPVDSGRDYLSREITDCEDDKALRRLGHMYCDTLMRCFRATKGRTPIMDSHPSRSSFDNMTEWIRAGLEEAPLSYSTAKTEALHRDQGRCIVSGKVDSLYSKSHSFRQHVNKYGGPPLRGMVDTECAHIIPDSTNHNVQGVNQNVEKNEYSASVWAVLERFSGVFFDDLNGDKIHHLENVITFAPDVHKLFDKLSLWLQPVDNTPHTYDVEVVSTWMRYGLPKRITLTSPDLGKYPLPNRQYLAVHAACAKIAHLSGAGEAIDKVLRDLERTKVLSRDGTSADLLHHALNNVSNARIVV